MDGPTWDVLISTIPHRDAKLRELLAEFDRQWQPGFGVRMLRDNIQRPALESHGKRHDLVHSSTADYVCDVDDDDWISPDYVPAIMEALQSRPDYVGFQANYTRDGAQCAVARHSLEYDGYEKHYAHSEFWTRDITHLNPIRRELALLADWNGKIDEDWSAQLRETGQVKTQVMIDRIMYYYRATSIDAFYTPRAPWTDPLDPLPDYPWLTIL